MSIWGTTMANGNGHIKVATALDWLMKFLIGVTTILVVSIWSTVSALDNRVTAIEASRFTTNDGLELWREVYDKVSRTELMNRLSHIEDMLQELRERP